MILVMLSGGMDSTLALHYVLTKPEFSGYSVHVHHMQLDNMENRLSAEDLAIKKIFKYFEDNKYRRFSYTSSKLSFPIINNVFMRDAYAVSFTSGFICNSDPRIKKVAIGVNATDMLDTGFSRMINISNSIFKSFTDAEKIFPVVEYTKKQVLELLPAELRKLCWSCRTPRYVHGVAVECGSCKTCNQLK